MADSTITIPQAEYVYLLNAEAELSALYAAGVDNWEGYELAFPDEEEED